MIRKGIRPAFKIAIGLPDEADGWRKDLPFRRSLIAIAILLVFDVIFLIPAVTTFGQAASEWGTFENLFDLVMALFMSAWLLGWMIGPLLVTCILAMLVFGKEVIRVRPGRVDIYIGLPLVGVIARYDVAKMRNLRLEQAQDNKRSRSWRGAHIVFDYGTNTIAVGSGVDDDDLAVLKSQIEMTTGMVIRSGEALPGEISGEWEAETSDLQESTPDSLPADPRLEGDPVTLTSVSTLALIVANLVPVSGAIFLGWNLGDVMVLYWAESAVIGFFNLCKIVVIARWMALLAGPFFVGHFGGFMSIHFLFVYSFFVKGIHGDTGTEDQLREVAQLFINLWPALAGLFISHAYSFYRNFLGRKEYRGRTMKKQMSEPYSRIIFMHLVLIFGGGLTMFLGQLTPVLLIVIALKIYFDVKAHLKQRLGA